MIKASADVPYRPDICGRTVGKVVSKDANTNDMAEVRTDLAEDRTIMANERTFAGWARTAMAAMGIALGFNALFGRLEPFWIPKLIATVFLMIAVLILLSAYNRANAVFERLDCHAVNSISRRNLLFVTAAMIAGAIALIACVWLLDWRFN